MCKLGNGLWDSVCPVPWVLGVLEYLFLESYYIHYNLCVVIPLLQKPYLIIFRTVGSSFMGLLVTCTVSQHLLSFLCE